MSTYIWLRAPLPPVKQPKELTWREKKKKKSIRLPRRSRFSLISACHYVYLCFEVCPSLSMAVELSDGAALSGIDHHQRSKALSTDGRVYDSSARGYRPRLCPSITLSTCRTMGGKCEKSREERRRRKGEGKHTSQQVHYHRHYLSIH